MERRVVWCVVVERGTSVSFFFFFKQKTAYEIVSRDWSSDVCSSDLIDNIDHHSVSINCESSTVENQATLPVR